MPPLIDKAILINGIKTEDLNTLEDWGKYLAPKNKDDKRALTTSQIRKFFGDIKRIQANYEIDKGDIVLLDPKIAYAVGRADKESRIIDFYKLVKPMIRDIEENKDKFSVFVSVIESIVAYHKASGGK